MLHRMVDEAEKRVKQEQAEEKVERSIKMTPALIKQWKELQKIRQEVKALEDKASRKRHVFWDTVSEEFNLYGISAKVNEDCTEIEVLVDRD